MSKTQINFAQIVTYCQLRQVDVVQKGIFLTTKLVNVVKNIFLDDKNYFM